MDKLNPSETFLGVDYGESNTGVALGRNGLVSPLRVLSNMDATNVIRELNRTAIENHVTQIVMGLPTTADGRETRESAAVRKFAKLFKIYSKKSVVFQNEFRSSIESMEESLKYGVSQKRRKKIDHFSAALILKRFFEEHR